MKQVNQKKKKKKEEKERERGVVINIFNTNIAISNIKFADYCCIISRISNSKEINLILIWPKKEEYYKT